MKAARNNVSAIALVAICACFSPAAQGNVFAGSLSRSYDVRLIKAVTPAAEHSVAVESTGQTATTEHLPVFYEGDTPFSTQVRVPLIAFWNGRLRFDGFYQELLTSGIFHGMDQSGDPWGITPGTVATPSNISYGISVSFHKPLPGPKNLCRYLFGKGAR